jgi:hypothetical protein
MKFKKGWHLVQVTLRKDGKAFHGLAGHDGFLFHNLPEDARVVLTNENRNEIVVTDRATFDTIKKTKVLHENLFPYDKSFDELEELK